MSASPVVKTGEEAKYHLIQKNISKVGLGEAAKRGVGTGENQIPDMASFASGDGWMKLPNGKILQYGRGAVTPTLSTQT
ncbi:phage tail protein, partial [Escherichia coli]